MPTLLDNAQQKALTTLARAKDFMSIGRDSFDGKITMLINIATGIIEQYVKRRLFRQTFTNEEYDGTGSKSITLRNFPLISVSSVQKRGSPTDAWQTVDSSEYIVRDYGTVEFIGDTVEGSLNYRFTYVAGYLINFASENDPAVHTLPQELEYACQKLVSRMFNTARAEGFKSSTLGSSTVSLKDKVVDDPEVLDILNRYAGPTIG